MSPPAELCLGYGPSRGGLVVDEANLPSLLFTACPQLCRISLINWASFSWPALYSTGGLMVHGLGWTDSFSSTAVCIWGTKIGCHFWTNFSSLIQRRILRARWTESGYRSSVLGLADLAGGAVDHLAGCAGVVDEHLLPSDVDLAHGRG